MKSHRFSPIVCLLLLFSSCESKQETLFSVEQAEEGLKVAMAQCELMYQSITDRSKYPITIKEDGETLFGGARNWTTGFYPGSLWYLYEYTGDEKFKEMAEATMASLEPLKTYAGTHDLGFMLYCSFGNGYRLTNDPEYAETLKMGTKTLASRYDSLTKCTLSWSWGGKYGWQFPVIIDNMMNLEMLFWGAKATGDPWFHDVAVTHAKTTMKNHYRDDFSCYHVVDYDTLTGAPAWRGTRQGAADSSAWARGQSWGLYGYTMCYRESKDEAFLEQAEQIAEFLLEHPNMPDDLVPYWDYDAPNIPEALRDASSAAIMASALLELSTYVDEPKKEKYAKAAEKMLHSLSQSQYRAKPGDNNYFVLKHSVGSFPKNSQVDVPFTYADYYYVEALLRYIELNS